MNVALSLLLMVFLGACATRPTTVKESQVRSRDDASAFALATPKVAPETVIVDARSAFDYSMAHVPSSVNVDWKSFTEADLFSLTRRIARLGISPETHVVVVGYGLKGEGEEGRVAWMLAYLGVRKVQFADLDSMKFRLTNLAETNPPKSVPMWKPMLREDLNATREEVLFVVNKNGLHQPVSFKSGTKPVLYRIIDTRLSDDYLGRKGLGAQKKVPDIGAVNIPWREFFDPAMRVRPEIAERLKEIDVHPENRIIVISEEGVSSAAVTLALRSLGFQNAANYSGGLKDLLSGKR